MKLPALFQLRVLKQAARAAISRPATTAFPWEPYRPPEGFRGRPRFREDRCIGCMACAQVCPSKCIECEDLVGDGPPRRRLTQHVEACIWCGQCERYCPTGAGITLTDEYDCAVFSLEGLEERVEKELLLCEMCGSVLAPTDQIRWLAKRLGPLAYANPTLMLVAGRDLQVVEAGVETAGGEVQRGDRMQIQCPRCRRKTALRM